MQLKLRRIGNVITFTFKRPKANPKAPHKILPPHSLHFLRFLFRILFLKTKDFASYYFFHLDQLQFYVTIFMWGVICKKGFEY